MSDKLKRLIKLCKCQISIEINPHKNDYLSVKDYLMQFPKDISDIADDDMDKMIKLDTIINIHFYPDTPIGFYNIYSYDLDLAFDRVFGTFDKVQV